MQLLFGDSRKISSDLLRLGSCAVVFFSLSTVTNAVLQGIDLMRKSVTHSTVSLLIHVIFVYVMLKWLDWGVYGLVIGLSLIHISWLTYPSCLACVVTSLGCIWLAAYIGETIRRDMEMENMKVRQAYYEELEKNQLAVRKLRHDMNNHLGVIGSFLAVSYTHLDVYKRQVQRLIIRQ